MRSGAQVGQRLAEFATVASATPDAAAATLAAAEWAARALDAARLVAAALGLVEPALP